MTEEIKVKINPSPCGKFCGGCDKRKGRKCTGLSRRGEFLLLIPTGDTFYRRSECVASTIKVVPSVSVERLKELFLSTAEVTATGDVVRYGLRELIKEKEDA